MPEILVSVGVFVVVFIGIGALLVPLAILRGWVLSILWGWFMVPVFGLPALGIAQSSLRADATRSTGILYAEPR